MIERRSAASVSQVGKRCDPTMDDLQKRWTGNSLKPRPCGTQSVNVGFEEVITGAPKPLAGR